MNIVEQNWDLILNKMKLEYCSSNISYTTWIAPLTVYEVKDNTVYILVQLRASLEHIEEKYLLPFKVCIAENRLSYQVINPRKISRHLKPVLGQDLSGDLLPISRRLIMRQEWQF